MESAKQIKSQVKKLLLFQPQCNKQRNETIPTGSWCSTKCRATIENTEQSTLHSIT